MLSSRNHDTQTHQIQSTDKTRCLPPPGIAWVPLARVALGLPQDNIRGHCAWTGIPVCSHATERQVDTSQDRREPKAGLTEDRGTEAWRKK